MSITYGNPSAKSVTFTRQPAELIDVLSQPDVAAAIAATLNGGETAAFVAYLARHGRHAAAHNFALAWAGGETPGDLEVTHLPEVDGLEFADGIGTHVLTLTGVDDAATIAGELEGDD